MKEFRADMHCHSYFSDGELSPEELLHLAKKTNLSALSITDHDTIQAYNEDLFALAKDLEVELVTGVEFSTRYKEVNVHILGYTFLLTDELNEFCIRHQERRRLRNLKILEKLRKHGFEINEQDLNQTKTHVIGRPHIALALMRKGYVKDMQEAFNRYIGDQQPCYDPGEPFSVEETLGHIHKAGGKAFIAHPQLIKRNRRLRELLMMQFDGIECYYSKLPHVYEEKWIQLAKEKGLLMSGGSDFHGSSKPNVTLGCSWIGEDLFRKILS